MSGNEKMEKIMECSVISIVEREREREEMFSYLYCRKRGNVRVNDPNPSPGKRILGDERPVRNGMKMKVEREGKREKRIGRDGMRKCFLTWKAWTRMKILSTPTARTRKGMTSTIINVAGTPRKRKKPRDETTERRTTNTPTRPRVNRASTRTVEQ